MTMLTGAPHLPGPPWIEIPMLALARLRSRALSLVTAATASALLAATVPMSGAFAGDPSQVMRFGGADRYAVAANTATQVSGGEVDTVYIASGEVYPDALGAGPAAARADLDSEHGGVLLLARRTSVPAATAAALSELAPRRIVVVGGPGTISDSVLTSLRRYAKSVTRITGADRYALSAAVSRRTSQADSIDTVFLASGEISSDAVAASGVASASYNSVLLTRKGSVPASVAAELKRLHPSRIVVVGGSSTVSDAVLRSVRPYADSVVRIGGKDRYEVSIHLADDLYQQADPESDDQSPLLGLVSVTSGTAWADSLSASNLQAPVILTAPNALPAGVAPLFRRDGVFLVSIVGGTASVSRTVQSQLVKATVALPED